MQIVRYINNIETPFILDSGATISVIDSEQVKLNNSQVQSGSMRVYTANGSVLNVDGRMNVEINFQNFLYNLFWFLIFVDQHYLILIFK